VTDWRKVTLSWQNADRRRERISKTDCYGCPPDSTDDVVSVITPSCCCCWWWCVWRHHPASWRHTISSSLCSMRRVNNAKEPGRSCFILLQRPRLAPAGGYCFGRDVCGSVRLWVCSPKWFDLLQLQIIS